MNEILTAASATFVLISVVLSWLSFRMGEVGATPDTAAQDSFVIDLEFDRTICEVGGRDRARLFAKLLFNLSSMAIVASVLVDLAKDSSGPISTGLIYIAIVTVLIDLAFVADSVVKAYRQRTETAFDAFYFGRGIGKYYRNTAAIKKLFFSMNWLPPGKLFGTTWESSLKFPTAEELLVAENAPSGNGPSSKRDIDVQLASDPVSNAKP